KGTRRGPGQTAFVFLCVLSGSRFSFLRSIRVHPRKSAVNDRFSRQKPPRHLHSANSERTRSMKFLSGFEPMAYAALRIVSGFLFSCHGAQKLFGAFGGHQVSIHTPLMLLAGIIEFGGGILILLGLLTHFAGLIASGEMAVAYFSQH